MHDPAPGPTLGPVLRPVLRPARRDDAADLARLADLAGEGLPRHLWSRLVEPGQSVWDVGVARAARDSGAFSWTNARIAELGGRVAGTMVVYPIAGTPGSVDDLPPLFRPLQELENLVPGTSYINILATYPDVRGRGVATALVAGAADAAGPADLSLIVADGNLGARAFYARLGFVEKARRVLVREDWATESRAWILLIRPAGPLAKAGAMG